MPCNKVHAHVGRAELIEDELGCGRQIGVPREDRYNVELTRQSHANTVDRQLYIDAFLSDVTITTVSERSRADLDCLPFRLPSCHLSSARGVADGIPSAVWHAPVNEHALNPRVWRSGRHQSPYFERGDLSFGGVSAVEPESLSASPVDILVVNEES